MKRAPTAAEMRLRQALSEAEGMRRVAELALLEKLRAEAAMPEWYPHG